MSINITQVAKVIRSKNAGPLKLTFDIIFKNLSTYKKVKNENFINKELISNLYKIKTSQIISIIHYDPAQAIKITIVRPQPCGSKGETDIYGTQQHVPLLDLELPLER